MARKTKPTTTEPERDPSTSPWPKRLARMKRYQKENSSSWEENMKLLLGKDSSDAKVAGQSSYGWGLVQNLITSIYVQNPEIMLEAYGGSDQQVGNLLMNACNYDFDQMDLKSLGNLGIIDAFTCGYAAVVETVQTDKEAKRFPEGEEPEGSEEGVAEVAESQNYIARRIHPKDILFDPGGTLLDLSDHSYLAVAFYPTVQSVQDDPAFKGNVPEDIDLYPESSTGKRQEKASGEGGRSPNQGDEKDPAFKRICVWEIHDKVNREIIYLTDAGHHELGRISLGFDLDIGGRKFFPVTLMAFFPSTTGFYPQPVIDRVAYQLRKLNEIDFEIIRDTMTKWRKAVTYGDALTPDQKAKLTDPDPANSVVTVDPTVISQLAGVQSNQVPDIDHIVSFIPDPSPSKDMLVVRDMIQSQIQDILGFGPPSRGGVGIPRTRSAREAVALKERLDARLNRLAESITEFYRWFGQKHVILLQKTLVVERYARILGDDAKALAQWKSYTQEDIQGTFHFIVYAGTTKARNTESYRQSEITLFNAIAPVLQGSGLPLAPAFLRLARAYDWKGVEEFFKNYKQAAKELAAVLFKAGTGQQVNPQELLQKATASVMATLSEGELAVLKRQLAGEPTQQGQAPGGREDMRGDPNPAGTATGTM